MSGSLQGLRFRHAEGLSSCAATQSALVASRCLLAVLRPSSLPHQFIFITLNTPICKPPGPYHGRREPQICCLPGSARRRSWKRSKLFLPLFPCRGGTGASAQNDKAVHKSLGNLLHSICSSSAGQTRGRRHIYITAD